MSDSRKRDLDDFGLQLFLNTLFQALEDVTLRNRAYSEVIRKEPNTRELTDRVNQADKNLRSLLDTGKYIDLQTQAIELAQAHSLSELAELSQRVQERVRVWGKP
jgi:hypothetical protein